MSIRSTTLAVACLLLCGCIGEPAIETSPRKYAAILQEWGSSGLVDHFPDSLPPSASNVTFSSFPGFLQGGSWIQVRMQLPAIEVKSKYNDAIHRAKQFHDGGDATTLLNQRPDGLASASFHTSDDEDWTFPDDYRVFVFDAQPYQHGSEFDWNHGTSRGVAISQERSEVIYWAENW